MNRDWIGSTVLEFGGGSSTLWWAERASRVVTFEEDPSWYRHLAQQIPANVSLHLVPVTTPEPCIGAIEAEIQRLETQKFDVIVIDGLCRDTLVRWSVNRLEESGILICDNAEGYRIWEASNDLPINRVDFFGHVPGVVLPQCTSVFFRSNCYLFQPRHKIPDIAKQ